MRSPASFERENRASIRTSRSMRNLPAPNSGCIFATSTAARDCCSAWPRATGCCISAPADAPGIRRTARPLRRWRPINILQAGFLREAGVPALGGEYFFLHDRHRAHRPAGHERSDAIDCFRGLGGSAFVKPLTGSRGDFAQAVPRRSRAGSVSRRRREVLRRGPDPADRRSNT